MTTDNTEIDFAEDGRLLALRTLCGDLEDDSAMSDSVSVMHVRSRLEYITEELGHVVAAYREVVLAAKAFRDAVKPSDGRMNVVLMDRTCKALDAAIARFRNITETP